MSIAQFNKFKKGMFKMSVHNDLLNDEKYILDELNNETPEPSQMYSFWDDEPEDMYSSWQADTC